MRLKRLALFLCLALAARAQAPKVKILLVGDSTVIDVAGWGAGLRVALSPDVECINLAQSGRSSKSYRDEGWWAKALAVKADYVLINFGGNDVPGKGPARETDPRTTYRQNMARYVEEARAAGMRPVLVTSMVLREFGPDGKLKPEATAPYVEAVRELAREKGVPLIDLYAETWALCTLLGSEGSEQHIGRIIPTADGKLIIPDHAHLGREGSLTIGRIVARNLARAVPALAGYILPEPTVPASTDPNPWVRAAQRQDYLTRNVEWFEHEPLAFLLRRGGTPADDAQEFARPSVSFGPVPENVEQIYARMHDRENIRPMAEAGMSDAGMIHFYKGFGLAAERSEIARASRAVEIAHQYGLKVCAYVAGTMFVETFYHEVPAARNWEARDAFNRPIPYAQTQTYRHFASAADPDYLAYLKGVIKVAIREVHPDQLMFDNFTFQPEPSSDHSPQAIAAFHAFLRQRYPTPEAAFRRFGIADPDLLQAPEWDNPATPDSLTEIDDPVLQEWERFRCELLAKYCGELYTYAKSLDRRVAVGFNLKGLFGLNRIWSSGVYHPLFAGHCDFLVFDTGGYDARIDASGALVSQIRSYKMGQALQITCVENHNMDDEVNAAVSMAFNYQKPLVGVGSLAGPLLLGGDNVFTPIFEFYRHYDNRYYTNTVAVADVAELRTWASMAYSIYDDYVPMTLAEQVLIQYKIPFDLLHEEQIARINRYPAVLMAGQDSVSDAQVERLLEYVRQGGTLILTDNTGAYDEHRELRAHNPFLPARSEGNGRIVWIPRILPAARASAAAAKEVKLELNVTGPTEARPHSFNPPQWLLPKNHRAIAATILASLPGGASLTTGAPLTTVAEIMRRDPSRETIVHFINFDRNAPVAPFAASVRETYFGHVKSVTCLSPDQNESVALSFQEAGGRVSFTVPGLKAYAMIVIAQ